jgi:hypothetical protein
VEITRHFPMKANQPIEGRLLHPIYVQGKLAVPANTLLHGTVIALEPDTRTRWHGRLRGDFTPFHTVQVRFDELMLPAGEVAFSAGTAANGAPLLHLASSGLPRQSFVARYWAQAKTQLRDRVAYFTAPGLGDRALQMLYHQLPFHPERIEAHTMWSFDLAAPLSLPDQPASAQLPDPFPRRQPASLKPGRSMPCSPPISPPPQPGPVIRSEPWLLSRSTTRTGSSWFLRAPSS